VRYTRAERGGGSASGGQFREAGPSEESGQEESSRRASHPGRRGLRALRRHEPAAPGRGDAGRFRKKRPPRTYRYDSSLSPALDWDGQNPARELGEWLLGLIERAAALPPPHAFEAPQEYRAADGTVTATVRTLVEAVDHLRRLGKPFLDWAGKAERLSFDVPTLPLFIHERLSTKAIVEMLVGHRRDKQQDMFSLFGDPQHSITDQVLRAYEYQDRWVNRLVLGDSLVVEYASFVDRMLEVLRKSPVLHVGGGRTVTLKNVRLPAKTLSLSAEAMVANGDEKPVALVFGPENGAISQALVNEALKEAYLKGYAHLYAIGFAIQPDARMLIEKAAEMGTVSATYVQATPDLMMGDLLKNMRSSQIFSVCGLPEVKLRTVKPERKGDPSRYQVELVGLDVFDPVTMQTQHVKGDDVPAWLLDTDYNDLAFHVCQAFFPRTSAWESLKRALGGKYEDSVWDHLAGTESAPFDPGEHRQVAVKVVDDRGNELLVVKRLEDAGL